jgi:TetR/AcrR family transcriptional regulator, tetracycline repressor protein
MTPRKKGVAAVTTNAIVDAALAIIDEQGLEACTMRRLGDRLGIDASSLYHHVRGQAEVFDLVADRIMGSVPVPAPAAPGDTPAETIAAAATGYFAAMTSHPRAVRLLVERPLRSTLVGQPFEQLVAAFFAAGLTPTQALWANGVLGWFLIGSVQNFASQTLEPGYASDTDVQRLREMAAGMPNFTRLMAEATPGDFATDFDRGLRALVRGLLEEADG